MSIRKFAGLIIIFVALVLMAIDTQAIFAISNSGEDTPVVPIERAKWMAFDETRSAMFVLNRDDTVSIFDVASGTFTLSRKPLVGVNNAYSFTTSQNGAFMAFSSVDRQLHQTSIFRVEDVINNQSPTPTARYALPVPAKGWPLSEFSPDSNIMVVSDGQGNIFFLDTEKTAQEKMSIDGSVPIKMAFDKYGRLLVLKEGSVNLDIIDISEKKVLATIQLGSMPKDVLYNSATDKMYVSHIGSEDVYVIDAQKLEVVGKIKVGSDPVAMTFDQNTGDVFVANNSAGTISIIASDFSVKTVDLRSPAYLNSSPLSFFYLSGEKKLFIINPSVAKLFVYDVATGKVIKEEQTSLSPAAIFGSEKLGTIFVRHTNADFIWQMDGKTLDARRIPEAGDVKDLFFSKPQGIAIDAERDKIFVSNVGDNTIVVIDGKTQVPATKIKVDSYIQAVVFQPVTKKLYGYSPANDSVTVIDTATDGYPSKVIQVGKQPRGIDINVVTNRVYVSNAADSSVSVIDGSTDQVIATISLQGGGYPLILSTNTNLNKVYSAAYGSNYVSVINAETNTLEKQIVVGQNPIWVRYIPEFKRVFVTVEGEKKIVIINPDNNEIVQTISTSISGSPYRLFIHRPSEYVYINFRKSNQMMVLAFDKDTSSFRIIKEPTIPYWGETDTIYNMVATNITKRFSYFTHGNKNRVVVVKNELATDNILDPVWYATINADGSVIYSQEAKEEVQTQENKKDSFVTLPNLIKLLVLGIIVAIIGIVIFMRRKSLQNNIPSNL